MKLGKIVKVHNVPAQDVDGDFIERSEQPAEQRPVDATIRPAAIQPSEKRFFSHMTKVAERVSVERQQL